MSGIVVGVCISAERGTAKKNIGRGYLRRGWGLEGDAHAGTDRQVSLLRIESVALVAKAHNLQINPGDFAENILIQGVDLRQMRPGRRLRLGNSIVEVTQIGKEVENHHYSFQGLRLLPVEGVFCRVLQSGWVRTGDAVTLIEDRPLRSVQCSGVGVMDRRGPFNV